MRTSCLTPTARAALPGQPTVVLHERPTLRLHCHPFSGWQVFVRFCMRLSLCSSVLGAMMLTGCSSVTTRMPAPIIDATILPADLDSGPPAECLPVPSVLSPLSMRPPAPIIHHPIRRPVKRPSVHRPEPETPPPPPEKPAAPPPLVIVHDLVTGTVRGLLDAQVLRGNGDVIGRAVDAAANAQGRLRDIVINLTGFMGVGDRKVSLPWASIQFNPAVSGPPVKLIGDTVKPSASSPSSGGSPPPAAGSMNLMDADVHTRNGTDVGRVVDILLDKNAQPLAVVLNISDSLIQDKRLVAADWSTLHVVGAGNAMHLETDLDNKQIEASPPYQGGKPPRIVSPAPLPAVAASTEASHGASDAGPKTPKASARAPAASRTTK